MSKYTPVVVIGPIEFDGDQVTIEVETLTISDMEVLAPFFKNADEQSAENNTKIIKIATELLPSKIKSISGLLLGDGATVSIDQFNSDLINKMYFVELVSEIINGLIEASTISKEDEGNS